MNGILTKEDIEAIYKDIRTNPKYVKHAQLQSAYRREGKILQAAREGKILKDMEVEVFKEIARNYVNSKNKFYELLNTMSEDDKNKLNTFENALYLLSDVLDLLVMDVNSVLKKYTTCKMKEYDKLQEVLKEARRCVCTFDKLMNDDKAVSMFSYSSDRLYKLIVNQASSYVNKLKDYEEGVNKKAARISKVAQGC